MNEGNRELVRQTIKAISVKIEEGELEKYIKNIPKELIDELAVNIKQLFRDWAYENNYIRREDIDEVCAEIAGERRSMMQEARD